MSRALPTVAAFALALALASPAWAEPTAEAKAGARAAASQGIAAYDEERYADALDLFKRAESLMHAPTHLLMIARSQAALGKLVAARESYLALSRETIEQSAPNAFKEAQADAQKELRDLEPRVPTVDVRLSDPSAENVVVTMDGKPIPAALVGVPHPVDPGAHVFQARGDRVISDEESLEVAEGGRSQLVLELRAAPERSGGTTGGTTPDQPPASSGALRIAGFVGIGVGVAGVAIGGIFTGLGFAERSEADDAYLACGESSCINGTPESNNVKELDDSASTKQTVGVIGLVAGGAIAATGVTLLLISPEGSAETALQLGPGSLTFRSTF